MIVLQLSSPSPSRAQLLSNEMVCSLGRSRMFKEINYDHILSNTAIWQYINVLPSKVTIFNDGRSKTSFSFSFLLSITF